MPSNHDFAYKKEHYTPEARSERFKRKFEFRVNRVLDDLRMIGNCSNRTLYSYDLDEVEAGFSYLQEALDVTKSKFYLSTKKQETFTLGDTDE